MSYIWRKAADRPLVPLQFAEFAATRLPRGGFLGSAAAVFTCLNADCVATRFRRVRTTAAVGRSANHGAYALLDLVLRPTLVYVGGLSTAKWGDEFLSTKIIYL